MEWFTVSQVPGKNLKYENTEGRLTAEPPSKYLDLIHNSCPLAHQWSLSSSRIAQVATEEGKSIIVTALKTRRIQKNSLHHFEFRHLQLQNLIHTGRPSKESSSLSEFRIAYYAWWCRLLWPDTNSPHWKEIVDFSLSWCDNCWWSW